VNTAFPLRRSEVVVGIGYSDQIPVARTAILTVLAELEGIEPDPAPEALAWELAGSSVNLKVRWWTDSRRTSVVHAQARVVEAIKGVLDREGIDMPFPTQVVLLHDQTEETDGIRGKQPKAGPRARTGSSPALRGRTTDPAQERSISWARCRTSSRSAGSASSCRARANTSRAMAWAAGLNWSAS
jgi:hypothetical protein